MEDIYASTGHSKWLEYDNNQRFSSGTINLNYYN